MSDDPLDLQARIDVLEEESAKLQAKYDRLLEDWREQDQALQDIYGACGVDSTEESPAAIAEIVVAALEART